MNELAPKVNSCPVCKSEIHQLAKLCKRCKKLVNRVDMRKKPDRAARIMALKQAWDADAQQFRCYYSGIRLVEDDPKDPRYLTFDHRVPRDEHDLVLAAACVNDMKSDLSEEEFRAVVQAFASRFSGGVFDERLLKLKHWKR